MHKVIPVARVRKLFVFSIALVGLIGCEKLPSQSNARSNSGNSIASQAQTDQDFKPLVVIPRAFPAIVKPDSVSADEASKSLHEGELVLGVEIDGQARAYPINMLTGPQREIINDELGGQSIAATW